jgi:PAS domain S-box-containing protein
MNRKARIEKQFDTLRKKAEDIIKMQPEFMRTQSVQDINAIIHELQVHQIELEMQNEELRIAQLQLEESRSKYSDLYDFAPVGYFTLDKNGVILETNLIGAEQLGVERSYLIKKPFPSFIAADDQDAFYFYRQRVFDKKTRQTCEVKIRRKDASEFYAHLTGTAMPDREGNYCIIRTALSDLSERRQTEEMVKEKQIFIQKIADTTPNILYIFDIREHTLVYSNRELTLMLGYTLEDIQELGEELYEKLIHPDDLPKVYEHLERLGTAADNDISEIEFRVKDINGKWHWLSNRNIVFSRTDEGLTREILGTSRDISDYKLTNEKLEHSVKQLARSNKELEQFAFIASHDLKTPLLSISGFTHLLEKEYEDKFNENAKEYFSFVKDGIQRMENLIDELLAYSRIGVSGSRSEFVEVNKIFVRIIANLTVDIERSGARITHDSLPVVHFNNTHMEQLLQNLIGNAVKFCSRETPQVHVSAEQKGDKWVFAVKDNGIGITPDDRDKIFDMFKRLDRSKYPGTGIGLAVCKKIVELHGGRIWIESQTDKGSIFYFTIPQTGTGN